MLVVRSFFLNRINLLLIAASFLLAAASAYFLTESNHHPGVEEITGRLLEVLDKVDNQISQFHDAFLNNPDWTQRASSDLALFFLVRDNEIIWWSDNRLWPPVAFTNHWSYIRLPAGHFLHKAHRLSENYHLMVFVPLQWVYRIQNEYLKPQLNEWIFGKRPLAIADSTSLAYAIELSGRSLFSVSISPGVHYAPQAGWGVVLGFLAIIPVMVLFGRWLKHPPASSIVMVVSWLLFLVGLRWLMISLSLPGAYITNPVFDPQYFASSWFNPSMGDLLLNSLAVLFACYLLFRHYGKFRIYRRSRSHTTIRHVILIILSVAVFFGWLYPFIVVQTLYNNSEITLGISDTIRFDNLRMLGFAVLLLAWLSAFFFIHVCARMLLVLRTRSGWWHIFTGLLVFSTLNWLSGQTFLSAAIVSLIFLVTIHHGRWLQTLARLTHRTVLYLLGILVGLSLISFVALKQYGLKRDVQQRKRMATYFLAERDNLAEYLLHEIRQKIEQDVFIRTRLNVPFLSREGIKQKIRQIYLSGYLARYKSEIFLFSSTGESWDEGVQMNLSTWLKHQEGFQKTEYEGIYYLRPDNEPAARYLVVIPISRESDIRGAFIVLHLFLPRFVSDHVYPALLVDSRYQPRFPSKEVNYAVYGMGKILLSSGNYAYDRFYDLDNNELYDNGLIYDGYHHVGVRDADGRVAVVSRPVIPLTYHLADLAFLLIIGIALLGSLLLITGTVEYREGRKLSLTTRIQLILNLSFVVTLAVVSVVTLGVTTQSVQQQLNADFRLRSANLARELTAWLNEEQGNYTLLSTEFLRKVRQSGLDANLYDAQGRLMATTQPSLLEYHLQAPVASPEVLQRIRRGESDFITRESIGRLSFYSAHAPVYAGENRMLVGFISTPFFQSAEKVDKLQTGVLARVLTVFLILLIVLAAAAMIATLWLVRPLKIIASQLGRVSLTGVNQPLHWPERDEIGLLVQQYNQMLVKLRESLAELERIHRERTWREMAQQVAHEIKNPLTPMKLTLQQLQRQAGNPEAVKRSIDLLMDQIDVLNEIATSFSMFAKMPDPEMERVNLVPLLENVVDLHNRSGKVHFRCNEKEAWVRGDVKLLNRIFSNLILNAIQAERNDEPVRVEVRLSREGSGFLIEIEDNGTGIDPAIRDKIFQPHFSTRRGGSGLGLAIARQGLELMNGSIGFETLQGKGTRFFVRIPAC